MGVLAGASSAKPLVAADYQETQPMHGPEEISAAFAMHRRDSKDAQEPDSQEPDEHDIPPSQVAEPPTPPKKSKVRFRWFHSKKYL